MVPYEVGYLHRWLLIHSRFLFLDDSIGFDGGCVVLTRQRSLSPILDESTGVFLTTFLRFLEAADSLPPFDKVFSKYQGMGIRRRNAPLPLIPSLKGRGDVRVSSPLRGLVRLWRKG